MVRERLNNGFSGWLMLLVAVVILVGGFYLSISNWRVGRFPVEMIAAIPLFVLILKGSFMVAPNQAVVLQLFGSYVGTAKENGLRWANPLYSKKKLSLRVRNFESAHLKVNDSDANPIEIAAVVVWRVFETAEALFEVDDYENYVRVQTEAALRNLATSYPYDAHDDAVPSLRGKCGRDLRPSEAGSPATTRESGRRGARGAHQPPGVRPGNRRGDAAAAAGRGHHRRATAHRRRRGRHGRNGACRCWPARASCTSTKSARRRW